MWAHRGSGVKLNGIDGFDAAAARRLVPFVVST